MVERPFPSAQLENFRSNPVMGVKQKTKVRTVLNVTAPVGASFHEAVDPDTLRKLGMSSAKEFRYKVLCIGREASFARYDLSDGFKINPGHP